MKNLKKKTATLVTLSVVSMIALARATAQAQTLNCNIPMDFGTVINCAGGGTLRIDPATGAPSVTGCIATAPGGFGITHPSCTVGQTDFPPNPIQVSVTAPTFNINSGGNSMSVNNIGLINPSAPTGGPGPVVTITAQDAAVDIGATLNVGASQPSGSYSGTVGITAIFQ
ncbi:MAG: DUF4402 domain-containing protein [Micavibrio sp.]